MSNAAFILTNLSIIRPISARSSRPEGCRASTEITTILGPVGYIRDLQLEKFKKTLGDGGRNGTKQTV
ncbi:MAG: hypothetical protein ACFCD0_01980 [Gemmataceae bacterium]